MRNKLPFLIGFLLACQVAVGQKYPQIPVLHGFVQNYQESKSETLLFPTGATTKLNVSGNKIFREFECKKTSTHPTSIQILKFHFNTISKLGGYMVYKTNEFAAFKVAINGQQLYVVVETYHDGLQYTLTIVEVESVKEADVDVLAAEDIFKRLNKDGHIAFYFSFESGESELTDEAYKGVSEIAKMLKDHPSLKLMIEGHTDNVGKPEDNISLSKKRASVVRNALIRAGVAHDRLIARGVGQANPIASNNTESGREKNRRVELVKVK